MSRGFNNEYVDNWLRENKNQFKRVDEYKNSSTPMKFHCLICENTWETNFDNLKRKIKQCPNCYGNKKLTTKEVKSWIEDNNVNIEILEGYERYHKHIKSKCLECGYIWGISFAKMKKGRGCPACARNIPLNNEVVDKWLNDNTNIVRVSEYTRANDVMKFKHLECGREWETTFNSINSGNSRCPDCASSKGETKILRFIKNGGFVYSSEHTFDDCFYKGKLFFDFIIFDKNNNPIVAIEFDGLQHFKPIPFFGGENSFSQTVIRDEIKNEYCKTNNIKMVRIPYYEYDNIEEILNSELKNIYSERKDYIE